MYMSSYLYSMFDKENIKFNNVRKHFKRSTQDCSSSRFTFTYKNMIIKTYNYKNASSSFCKKEINNEIYIWKNLEPQDRKYFVPLLWWKQDEYVIQPFCRFRDNLIDDLPSDVYSEHKETINHICRVYGLDDVDFETFYNVSMLWDGSRPVIYDYGSLHSRPSADL